jgi:uncharacterized protein YaaQ
VASTALVKDVLWRVSSLAGDTSPQFETWPEGELVMFFDDAQTAVAKFLPSSVAGVYPVKLKAGARQSIDTILPSNYLRPDGSAPTATLYGKLLIEVGYNLGANGLTDGPGIFVIDEKSLKAVDPNWRTTTGATVQSYIHRPGTPREFWVYPAVPVSTAVWVEISLQAAPAKIINTGAPGTERYLRSGSATDTISVDDEHVDDLVNYIMARVKMKDAPENARAAAEAAGYTQMFTGSINGKAMAIGGTNPNLKRLPMATEPIGQAA